jgi:phage/plasmid primase-like uncharacterized protein
LSIGDVQPLLVHCRGGCNHDEIMSELSERGLLEDDDDLVADLPPRAPRPDRQRDEADYRTRRTEEARRLYEAGIADERIEIYLRSRGINTVPSVLRFCEATPHDRLRIKLPAMLAPVVNVAGELVALHKTFLKRDGTAKAELDKIYQRETCGPKKGGMIRIAAFDPGRALLIGEGIETSLSAMALLGLPGWAGIDADNIRTALALPPDVRSVAIAADNDERGAGPRAAAAACDRWCSEGRTVDVFMPDRPGDDFNDVLMRSVR